MNTQNPVFAGPAGELTRWRFSPLAWGLVIIGVVAACQPFTNVLLGLYYAWAFKPEYSHGIVVPMVSIFLIWRERDRLSHMPFQGSWMGPAIALLGFVLWYASALSTIPVIGQYAFVVVVYGFVLALAGTAVFRAIAVPMFILLFMIPLPAFFSNTLSLNLELLSSSIGVDIIRLFGISVFLEGNVIDLGTFKLQVVEACDGLRYLFPLMTLAFIVAYFFRATFWKRSLLFLSSIPIAILMNSGRIGLIGVTVEYWGERMAEGILHDFEGWVVFMLSLGVLLAFAAGLNRIGQPGAKLRDALALDFGAPIRPAPSNLPRPVALPFVLATLLAIVSDVIGMNLPDRVELQPTRESFTEFPDHLGAWQMTREPLEAEYREALHVDDYLLANFRRAAEPPINLWIAWYNSQRSGQATHSPKSCLPGGGWEMRDFGPREIALGNGRRLTLNRAIIEQGNDRQLVYYWFQQRGRAITDEYLVKWYIFYDAITRNRTDGALVRLIAPIPVGTDEAAVEGALTEFTKTVVKTLPAYLPN